MWKRIKQKWRVVVGAVICSALLLTASIYNYRHEPEINERCGAIVFRNLLVAGETPPAPVCVREKNGSLFLYHPDNPDVQIRVLMGEPGLRLLEGEIY